MSENKPRWHYEAYYRTDDGGEIIEGDIQEIMDLHRIVELGPNWGGLDHIKITMNHDDGRTVEEHMQDLEDMDRGDLIRAAEIAANQNPMNRKLN